MEEINPSSLTLSDRAALAFWFLLEGEQLTLEEIAARLGYASQRGCRAMLNNISRVVPIVQIDGAWQICPQAWRFVHLRRPAHVSQPLRRAGR